MGPSSKDFFEQNGDPCLRIFAEKVTHLGGTSPYALTCEYPPGIGQCSGSFNLSKDQPLAFVLVDEHCCHHVYTIWKGLHILPVLSFFKVAVCRCLQAFSKGDREAVDNEFPGNSAHQSCHLFLLQCRSTIFLCCLLCHYWSLTNPWI